MIEFRFFAILQPTKQRISKKKRIYFFTDVWRNEKYRIFIFDKNCVFVWRKEKKKTNKRRIGYNFFLRFFLSFALWD